MGQHTHGDFKNFSYNLGKEEIHFLSEDKSKQG